MVMASGPHPLAPIEMCVLSKRHLSRNVSAAVGQRDIATLHARTPENARLSELRVACLEWMDGRWWGGGGEEYRERFFEHEQMVCV